MPLISSYKHGEFCWAELVAHDMQSAIAFYNDVMTWKTADLNSDCDDQMPHVQFESEGQPVAGLIQLSDPLKEAGLPSVWNTYVCVDDLAATLEKAEKAGGKITYPITEAGEHGLVAFLQDPTGGIVGLWQRGTHGGESVRGELNSLCWNELATRDAAKACEFYKEIFGWSFKDQSPSPAPYFVIVSTSGEELGGIMQMTEEWGEMPSHWTIYFRVDAVDAVAVSVQKMNGTMVIAPFDTPVGRIAVLADNQGAVFNVIRIEAIPPTEPAAAETQSEQPSNS